MTYMPTSSPRSEVVNDIHSGLNPASMRVHRPTNADDISQLVRAAMRDGSPVALCGGRHAMGGQQFADGGELLDLRGMNRILELDMDRGLVRAEGGIQWPALISGVLDLQRHREADRQPRWGIAQKQTGADLLTLGGALSANVHGRGLLMAPIVSDVEAFTLIPVSGDALTCSRTENPELFSLAIGGYGLFGVIADVTLRLTARRTLRRVVRVIDIEDAVIAAERRIREGFLYGDFQFDIDPRSPSFLTKGVFSGYCPVDGDPTPPPEQRALSGDDWLNLLTLAHTDKSRAFTLYAQHYLATDGQLYSSDTHQLTEYLENYHHEIDRRTGAACSGSEMITELYVPPERLVEFLHATAPLLIERSAPVIYGTVRLIQPDTETVMRWASQRFACIIFNLHVDHEAASIERAAGTFRALIDLASDLGGSYYLTYHRFATPQQFERCYPRVREFFNAKRRFDPAGIFQSDWYNHYAPHFEGK
jgi:FAD/FMN-containing dehydrogenase